MKKHSGKPRGAKAKQRLKDKKLKPAIRLQKFSSFKQLKGIKETAAEKKEHKQYFSLLGKYYSLRKRLLLKQCGPFYREMKRVGFRCANNSMYLAYNNAFHHHYNKNKYLRSFKNY